jgi:hypothetical protein
VTATLDRLTAAGYAPCPAQAAPAPAGTPVWSVRLNWGLVSGDLYRNRYGVPGGELGHPAILTVRAAADSYLCADCRHAIPRGALHGSNAGAHYCVCCIITTQPESQFRTRAA